MKKKKYKVMLVSGGFDPVHKGHLEMIVEAQKQAEEVWVILNNDFWLRQKKGQEFMDQVLYVYNDFNPISDHNIRRKCQIIAAKEIRKKKKYNKEKFI